MNNQNQSPATQPPTTDYLLSRLDNFINNIDNKLDTKLDSFRNWGILIIGLFGIVFGFLFYFVDDRYQEQIARLNNDVYTPTNRILNNKINQLQSTTQKNNEQINPRIKVEKPKKTSGAKTK